MIGSERCNQPAGAHGAFIGYLGKNLCDAVAVGEVFSSPPANAFLAAFRAADAGRGIACLYGNYAGDNMNVKLAIEEAEEEGIVVKTVVANDDVPSAPADQRQNVPWLRLFGHHWPNPMKESFVQFSFDA